MKATIFTANTPGIVTQTPYMTVVRHIAQAGTSIEKHNHPHHVLVFTLLSGELTVTVGDVTQAMHTGDVLTFDGNDYISANIHKDSHIVVSLINKEHE